MTHGIGPVLRRGAATRPSDVLGRFVAPREAAAQEERCDLCGTPVHDGHSHLVDLERRRLACACPPCALLFDRGTASTARFKRVPSARRRVADPVIGPAFWERLQIPVRLAFFFENSEEQRRVAFYPGPAGATESLLPLDAWRDVVADNPLFATLESDVEAVLLRQPERGAPECYLVPVDVCYALTGVVRRTWKGFEGGTDAWQEIDRFFEQLRAEANEVSGGGRS